MSVFFVTFATPAFRVRQWLLVRSALACGGADHVRCWNRAGLRRDGFIQRHADLFPGSTGFGWYAWKPHIILRALEEACDGDLVVYQDVGRRDPVLIGRPLSHWYDVLDRHRSHCIAGVAIPGFGPNKWWTKSSVFRQLNLADARYAEQPQIQASWSVWRKCTASVSFVREWARLCTDRRLVGGELENGPSGEIDGFREHRWDQSILTLLALRDSLPVVSVGNMRHPDLDAKNIDSFAPGQKAAHHFRAFEIASVLYHRFESITKPLIGLGGPPSR